MIQRLLQQSRKKQQLRQSVLPKMFVVWILLFSFLVPLSQARQQQQQPVVLHTAFKSPLAVLPLLSFSGSKLSFPPNNRRRILRSHQLGFIRSPCQPTKRTVTIADSLRTKVVDGPNKPKKNTICFPLQNLYAILDNDNDQVDYDIISTTSGNNQRIQRNFDGNDDSLRLVRNIDDEDDDDDNLVHRNLDRRVTTNAIVRSQLNKDDNKTEVDNNNDDDEYQDGKEETADEERKKQMRRHKYWVLLVDDEESIRTAVGDYLYDSGYQVTACSDSDATLNVLSIASSGSTQGVKSRRKQVNRKNRRLPDVIVLDIRMPGSTMNGIELLQWIRSQSTDPILQTIPIVMLTAKGLTQDRIVGYKAGATAYLSKPFNPSELLSIIDNAIVRNEQMKYSTTIVPTTTTTIDSVFNTSRTTAAASTSASPIALLEMQNDIETIKELVQKQQQQQVSNTINVRTTDIYLTPTECEVLEYLGQGLTKQEIATARNVTSMQSITRVLNNLYRKTNVSTRTELIRWALETGYLLPNNNNNNRRRNPKR